MQNSMVKGFAAASHMEVERIAMTKIGNTQMSTTARQLQDTVDILFEIKADSPAQAQTFKTQVGAASASDISQEIAAVGVKFGSSLKVISVTALVVVVSQSPTPSPTKAARYFTPAFTLASICDTSIRRGELSSQLFSRLFLHSYHNTVSFVLVETDHEIDFVWSKATKDVVVTAVHSKKVRLELRAQPSVSAVTTNPVFRIEEALHAVRVDPPTEIKHKAHYQASAAPTPAPATNIKMPSAINITLRFSDGELLSAPKVCQISIVSDEDPAMDGAEATAVEIGWVWCMGFIVLLMVLLCVAEMQPAALKIEPKSRYVNVTVNIEDGEQQPARKQGGDTIIGVLDKPTEAKPSGKKLEYLDGLRGVMCLVVVCHHFCCAIFPVLIFGRMPDLESRNVTVAPKGAIGVSKSPLAVLWAGTFAVVVFFVMSGHVVALRYLKTRATKDLVRSAVCRIPRMAIPVIAALVWNWVLAAASAYKNMEASEVSGSYWLRVFDSSGVNAGSTFRTWGATSFFFFFSGQGHEHARLEYEHFPGFVIWTIPLEVRGSFLVYAVAFVSVQLRTRLHSPVLALCGKCAMYSVLLLIFLIPDPIFSQIYCHNNGAACPLADPLPSPTLRYYAAFIVGLILAEVRCTGYLDVLAGAKSRGKVEGPGVIPAVRTIGLTEKLPPPGTPPACQEPLRALAKCTMLVLAFVVSGWYRLYDEGAMGVINGANADIVIVIGASSLVVCVCVSPRMQHWLMRQPILYLGRISFALYLLHTTVIFSLVCAIFSSGLSYSAASALAVIAMSAVLLPLSHAFTVLVDETIAVKGVRVVFKRAVSCAKQTDQSVRAQQVEIALAESRAVENRREPMASAPVPCAPSRGGEDPNEYSQIGLLFSGLGTR